jgi:hypothetical protein
MQPVKIFKQFSKPACFEAPLSDASRSLMMELFKTIKAHIADETEERYRGEDGSNKIMRET